MYLVYTLQCSNYNSVLYSTSIIECIEVNIIQPLDNQQVLQKLHVRKYVGPKPSSLCISKNEALERVLSSL